MMQDDYKMLFGKYKGTPLKDIPSDYAAWLLHDGIIKGSSKKAFEEIIWQRIVRDRRDQLIEEWVNDNYKVRPSKGSNYEGYDPTDCGYDSPYDEFDAYGNLTWDLGV